jgi:hypothetical protein
MYLSKSPKVFAEPDLVTTVDCMRTGASDASFIAELYSDLIPVQSSPST